MEKSSKPCLRLATALPETAAGIEGNFASPDAPRRIAAQLASRTRADSFCIPVILPHLFSTVDLRIRLEPEFSEPCFLEPGFSEPRLAAVFAVGIAKRGFQNLGFAAGPQRLHYDEGQ